MKRKFKQIAQWVFIGGMAVWSISSAIQDARWTTLCMLAGSILFTVMILLCIRLFGNKTKKLIHENLTPSEKMEFSEISAKLGGHAGTRIAPIGILLTLSYMLLGKASLIYAVPITVITLAFVYRSVWKENRMKMDAFYLGTKFAQENGITILEKKLCQPSPPEDGLNAASKA
jgi:hypothetical protein